MNPIEIIKDAWRITRHTGALWILTGLLYLVMIPEMVLSGGIGAASAAVIMPQASRIELFQPLRNLPAWVWGILFLVTMAVLVATTTITWGLQAASMRATILAVEGERVTVGGALRLGGQRWNSILKLSLTFGVLIGLLALLPPIALILLARGTEWGMPLMQGYQAVLNPISSVLGIVLMLVMMAVAVEDLRPRMAFRRAWAVFRAGWWGFLLMVAANFGLGLVFAVVLVPMMVLVVFLAVGGAALGIPAAPVLAGLVCQCASPFALALLIFVMILSTVLYTLTYRAAAALAGPSPDATPVPGAT
jgi:hypothetical protein